MSRLSMTVALWFGLAIAVTQIAGAAIEAWRTKPKTDADVAQALDVGPRTADPSCDTCGRP